MLESGTKSNTSQSLVVLLLLVLFGALGCSNNGKVVRAEIRERPKSGELLPRVLVHVTGAKARAIGDCFPKAGQRRQNWVQGVIACKPEVEVLLWRSTSG